MLALFQLIIVGFVALTVVYISLSLYSRAQRREKLEAQWEEEGRTGDREAFVREGLEAYDDSVRRKLILGVYVVPLALIAVIVYMNNFY